MQNDQKSKAYAAVFRFVKENLWLFGLGLLCSMLNTAFNSLTPQIIRMTVDSIIGSEELPGWFTALGLQRLLQGDTARVLLLAAAAVLAAGNQALSLGMTLIGGMMIWGGLMAILQESGAMGPVSRWMRKLLQPLVRRDLS